MSDPAPHLRPARWLDRASMLLVVASLAVATGAASPSLLRAAGLAVLPPPAVADPPPHLVRPPVDPPSRPRNSASDENPRFFPADDPPRLTELERELLRGAQPGDEPRPDIFAPAPRQQAGIARAPLTVRERADINAKIAGRVPAGAPVKLLLEKGEWALVAYRTAEGVVMGWTARSAVIVP